MPTRFASCFSQNRSANDHTIKWKRPSLTTDNKCYFEWTSGRCPETTLQRDARQMCCPREHIQKKLQPWTTTADSNMCGKTYAPALRPKLMQAITTMCDVSVFVSQTNLRARIHAVRISQLHVSYISSRSDQEAFADQARKTNNEQCSIIKRWCCNMGGCQVCITLPVQSTCAHVVTIDETAT